MLYYKQLRMFNIVVFAILLVTGFVSTGGLSPRDSDFEPVWKCVPIKLDFCKDIVYNMTIEMTSTKPNPYTDKNSQQESDSILKTFKFLLESGCSKNLRLLLCSIYLPYCDVKHLKGIRACRPMCEDVKSNCLKFLEDAGYPWPAVLNCNKLPAKNQPASEGTKEVFCLPGDQPVHSKIKTTRLPKTKTKTLIPDSNIYTVSKDSNTDRSSTDEVLSKEKYCKIRYSRNMKNYIFVEKIQSCALECMKDGLFTIKEKQLTEHWLTALALICGILCFAALLCALVNYNETTFPERAIVFIALCYCFYSLSYVIRIVHSREGVTCQEEKGRSYLLVDGSDNRSCAATFLLAYCFSMVQNIWWVVLCLTWFLSAGMKWTPKAIHTKNRIFHALAWGIPCLMTVIVLVWRKIDVNELTGICSIGNRYENLRALRWLVLGPIFVFLIMAIMFLLFGLICICQFSLQNEDGLENRVKVHHLFLPVGSHAALQTLFTTLILASYFYEHANKGSWYHDPASNGPNFAIFLIRIISDFSIGISAAFWLLFLHVPRIRRKMKVKLYQTDLLLPKDAVHRLPENTKQASTNETSI